MAEKEKPTPAPKSEKSETVETTVREIRRATRKKYSAEEKIRIVLEGLRGETGVRELCRRDTADTLSVNPRAAAPMTATTTCFHFIRSSRAVCAESISDLMCSKAVSPASHKNDTRPVLPAR